MTGSIKLKLPMLILSIFGHQLHHAKELVDQCLHEWSEDARPEIQVLISGAF